ncbi:MAG: hypothetical protein K6U80_20150, partial [Firmicutes bacterium]|nr:hypothetical protein [Bacillota bacterium]
FGEQIGPEVEEVANTHAFTGKDWDADVGLYYFNARWYDPELGRFISQDTYPGTPDEPWTLNLYTYCYNNPLINTDPTGHDVGFAQNPVCNPDYQQFLIDSMEAGLDPNVVMEIVPPEMYLETRSIPSSSPMSGPYYGQNAGKQYRIYQAKTGDRDLSFEEFVKRMTPIWIYLLNHPEEGLNELDVCINFMLLITGLDNYKDIPEAILGRSLISGEKLSGWNRALILLPFVSAGVVKSIEKVKEILDISDATSDLAKTIKRLAASATKNKDSSIVLLGKYSRFGRSYDNVAKEIGATYFYLDNYDELMVRLGKNNMWEINKEFLIQQWAAGKEFYFSHNPWEATGTFVKEVEYLIDLGVKDFVKIGDNLWKAIR